MLRQRLAVGAPLGCLALASFLFPGWPGALLFLCLGGFLIVEGLREFHNMAEAMGLPGARQACYLAGHFQIISHYRIVPALYIDAAFEACCPKLGDYARPVAVAETRCSMVCERRQRLKFLLNCDIRGNR